MSKQRILQNMHIWCFVRGVRVTIFSIKWHFIQDNHQCDILILNVAHKPLYQEV